jgi:hypothetical protein
MLFYLTKVLLRNNIPYYEKLIRYVVNRLQLLDVLFKIQQLTAKR